MATILSMGSVSGEYIDVRPAGCSHARLPISEPRTYMHDGINKTKDQVGVPNCRVSGSNSAVFGGRDRVKMSLTIR